MMHLYFQSAHEEHQMGLEQTCIQIFEMQYALLLCVASLFNLHKQEALTSLHHKKDLLKDLLGVGDIPINWQ
jgi:hypothetical protein